MEHTAERVAQLGAEAAQAMSVEVATSWLFLIPLLPLLGAIAIALMSLPFGPAHGKHGEGRSRLDELTGWVATGAAALSFFVALYLFPFAADTAGVTFPGWTWFRVDQLHVHFAL